MNKIYQDAIEKASAIAQGVGNNAAELKQKGFDTSVSQTLAELAKELSTEAEEYDKLNDAASAQRQKCHDILDRLKAILADSKRGIKQRYDQPSWARFGVFAKK